MILEKNTRMILRGWPKNSKVLVFFNELALTCFSLFPISFATTMQKITINKSLWCGISNNFLQIQVILVPFQQGINSFIKPLTKNYHINSICIDDIIALKNTLNNVLITLNASKIRDVDLINHNTMPKGGIYDSIYDYKS